MYPSAGSVACCTPSQGGSGSVQVATRLPFPALCQGHRWRAAARRRLVSGAAALPPYYDQWGQLGSYSQLKCSSPDNSGEHALFDTCATSFDRHCGCNSWDFNKIDGVACYEKGPMQICACAYMPPSIAIDGSEKLYDWTCSGFTCTQRNFNTDMSSPYPGFAQCRKAMKPDGSSPFPNKPSYQQCPDTWACHEADVGQTCFTPFSEKAGLVPKGGPPEDLCDNTCTTYKSFSTKCHDLASPSAGSAYCPLGTDCDRCGSRTTKTLGSYWVLAATHYSTGRRKRSTKQCRQLCAGDVSCKIFYVAFSYAPATTTWTMECYTNQNTAEIELLTDDTMLGLQEDTSAAQATKAVFVKVNCATRKETHPVAKEGYMGGTRSSAPLSRIQHCRKGPCNNPNHWSIMSGSYYYACGGVL
ncbi:hypothetical protein EMIHUDRAFT_242003 [Emiliania huxleyi CCMP1516]|uniref:Apple domain-containing protein n=2 Tax=Emiliania huxleyi TaxID=2903 RepID=A0A0D3JAV1_EMIH1|nr:hypothetical protein EMIHUDRAFT_242003 [Emiliania huxleyi CCMP1516]EOD20636.1 hypothetical protein EMIHUDRAFT_242003 [Emiliania huxleyi CCMP1516]|eukprot:XP_005773065.1 hypothetical protein EMIHUDRAFT_242003 [Emiliania huxleyi CCMP1516]